MFIFLLLKKQWEVSAEGVGEWEWEGKNITGSKKKICLHFNKLSLALFWYHLVL